MHVYSVKENDNIIPFEWYDPMMGLSGPLSLPAHGRCRDHDKGTPVIQE